MISFALLVAVHETVAALFTLAVLRSKHAFPEECTKDITTCPVRDRFSRNHIGGTFWVLAGAWAIVACLAK